MQQEKKPLPDTFFADQRVRRALCRIIDIALGKEKNRGNDEKRSAREEGKAQARKFE